MRVGFADVFTGENGRDARLFLEMITSIEAMGFVSYWASDHMFQFPADELASQHPDGPRSPAAVKRRGMYDCLTLLTAAIARTDTLRVGTEISLLPLREPVQTARQLATLDHLSGGRVDFGVGVGWMKEEYDAMGVDWRSRGRRLDEYLRVLKVLWTTERSTYHGDFVDFENVLAYPKPIQQPHVPLYIGGNSKFAARRTAVLGDGWIGSDLSPEEIEAFLAVLDEELAAQHRKRDDLVLKVTRPMSTRTSTPADWEEDAKYVRDIEPLGIDEVICSHRRGPENYLEELAAYASTLGLS